jgi:hypothetical protein
VGLEKTRRRDSGCLEGIRARVLKQTHARQPVDDAALDAEVKTR